VTESTSSATERVGRYQLLDPIGSGPTGAVWRAKVFGVAGFERQFAVKRFLPEVTSTPAAAQALSAGARAYGSLEHPRIARMTEFGVAQGQTFTAVELVPGLDAMRLAAEAQLAGVPLAAGGVLALVSQVARAIGYAHGRGISHLGLSPTNVIVTPDGDVKVTDFAILAATLPARPADAARLALRIAYLAPEQLAAEATSAATDVFALGVLAYELVTGQRTFRGDTPQQIAQAIMAGPPAEPALPRPIVRVLQRCFARSPFERFPDARAFADALDAALRVAPVPGSRKDIGAQVKATLERIADLHDNELSGVLALNLGTGPVSRVEATELGSALGRDSRELIDPAAAPDPKTAEYVRPDLAVPGPAQLTGPLREVPDDSGRTHPDLRPMTMPGLAPPPIPAPRSIPAIPPMKRPGSSSEPPLDARVGNRIQTAVATVPSLAPPRAVIPARSPAPALFARLPSPSAPLASGDLSAFAAELGTYAGDLSLDDAVDALGDEPPTGVAGEHRQRTMLDARTEPGVGIQPTAPHQPPTESAPRPAAPRPGAPGAFPDDESSGVDARELPALGHVPALPPAAPAPTQPGIGPPLPVQTAPLRLPSEPPPMRLRPRRWPWIVAGLLTLGVIGAVSYVVLVTLADEGGQPAVSDAAVAVAVTAPMDARPADASAAPDAAARPPAPDAAVAAVAPPDAPTPPPAVPGDAAVAAVAPPDAPTATVTPSAPGDALVISSTPPGAHLFIDGADQGVTPATLAGSAARRTVVLLLPGHDLYVAAVDGHGAFAIPLKQVTPASGPAGIKVLKCAKDRYYVFVDGKPTGQLCPTERINCTVGPHTVETYDAVSGTRKKWDIVVPDERLSVRVRVE